MINQHLQNGKVISETKIIQEILDLTKLLPGSNNDETAFNNNKVQSHSKMLTV